MFRHALHLLLEADPTATLLRSVSLHQSELAPLYEDWQRLDLVSGGQRSEVCTLVPFLGPSCDALLDRPEINSKCETYLAGASVAKLMPGAQLKPHFDSHGRLAVHLGLDIPEGASMVVGGEEVHWVEGQALVFDDTYPHEVKHVGHAPRYVLVAWFCHPCDASWRDGLGDEWKDANPLPRVCGPQAGAPPIAGYGEHL